MDIDVSGGPRSNVLDQGPTGADGSRTRTAKPTRWRAGDAENRDVVGHAQRPPR
jgi:hypothetical protein